MYVCRYASICYLLGFCDFGGAYLVQVRTICLIAGYYYTFPTSVKNDTPLNSAQARAVPRGGVGRNDCLCDQYTHAKDYTTLILGLSIPFPFFLPDQVNPQDHSYKQDAYPYGRQDPSLRTMKATVSRPVNPIPLELLELFDISFSFGYFSFNLIHGGMYMHISHMPSALASRSPAQIGTPEYHTPEVKQWHAGSLKAGTMSWITGCWSNFSKKSSGNIILWPPSDINSQ